MLQKTDPRIGTTLATPNAIFLERFIVATHLFDVLHKYTTMRVIINYPSGISTKISFVAAAADPKIPSPPSPFTFARSGSYCALPVQ